MELAVIVVLVVAGAMIPGNPKILFFRLKPPLETGPVLSPTQKETRQAAFLGTWIVVLLLPRSYSCASSSTVSPAYTSSSAKTTMADDAVGVTFRTTTSPTARRGRSPT